MRLYGIIAPEVAWLSGFLKVVMSKRTSRARLAAYVAALGCMVVFFITGCGNKNPVAKGVDRDTRVRMNLLATFYSKYQSDHRGKLPKDEDAFREFLLSQDASIRSYKERGLIETGEDLLTSARDGKPFIVVCGKPIPVSDAPDYSWVAYEQTGIDGERMAIRSRGGVELLDSKRFSKEFQ